MITTDVPETPEVLDSAPKLKKGKSYLGFLVDHEDQLIGDVSSMKDGAELILLICCEFSDFRSIPKLNTANGVSFSCVNVSKLNDDSDVVSADLAMNAAHSAHYVSAMLGKQSMYQIGPAFRLLAAIDLSDDDMESNNEIIVKKLQKNKGGDYVYLISLGDGEYIPCRQKVGQVFDGIGSKITGFFDGVLAHC